VVEAADGQRTAVEHGVVIVATGAREDLPELYGLGAGPKVVSGMQLEKMLADGDEALTSAQAVGFILCAGSLDENKPYCSRTCCAQSIKNAIPAQGAAAGSPRARLVQGGAHVRSARGVLHQGA